jgi:hypothetical protein
MNILLKTLAAIALILVIVAAAVFILKEGSKPVQPTPPPVAVAPPVQQPQPATQTPPGAPAPAPVVQPAPADSRNAQTITSKIDVARDNPLQPAYKPVNQPAMLQLLRQEGKTYHSRIVGKLNGKATKADWGFQGSAYFNYIYVVDSTGKILKNDGVTIVEERQFKQVKENLLVSEYEVGIDLGNGLLSGIIDFITGANTAENANGTAIKIPPHWVELGRDNGLFKQLPQIDPNQYTDELRMFATGSHERLLEGKTVRITFVDGQGITSIEPVNCTLSERERDVIIRTNFVMDHYVFPDHQVSPGDDWTVDGSVFSGFLDPRLEGKAEGSLTVTRQGDFVAPNGAVSKKLKLTQGNITVRDQNATNVINGELLNVTGVLIIPDKEGVVTSAILKGSANYQNLSTDHLLFQAKHAVQPEFNVRYECSVE